MTAHTSPQLLQLPEELRQRIFSLALSDNTIYVAADVKKFNDTGNICGSELPGLVFSCKQACLETAELSFAHTIYYFSSICSLLDWARKLEVAIDETQAFLPGTLRLNAKVCLLVTAVVDNQSTIDELIADAQDDIDLAAESLPRFSKRLSAVVSHSGGKAIKTIKPAGPIVKQTRRSSKLVGQQQMRMYWGGFETTGKCKTLLEELKQNFGKVKTNVISFQLPPADKDEEMEESIAEFAEANQQMIMSPSLGVVKKRGMHRIARVASDEGYGSGEEQDQNRKSCVPTLEDELATCEADSDGE